MSDLQYFVITLGRRDLMARFDDDGRLVKWTPFIRDASLFLTSSAAAEAIRDICRPELDAAVAAGRAVRELDEETGEVVVMDYRRRSPRPMPPRISLGGHPRRIEYDSEQHGRTSVRAFVRGEFKAVRSNPTRATEARIHPSTDTADEWTMAASKRARAMAGYKRSA